MLLPVYKETQFPVWKRSFQWRNAFSILYTQFLLQKCKLHYENVVSNTEAVSSIQKCSLQFPIRKYNFHYSYCCKPEFKLDLGSWVYSHSCNGYCIYVIKTVFLYWKLRFCIGNCVYMLKTAFRIGNICQQ